jgi:hypothetical protein
LRPGGPVATSFEAWFLDGLGWSPATMGSRRKRISMEPGIFMKTKQLGGIAEMTRLFPENQVLEIKSVIDFYCRLLWSKKMIAEMKV